MKRMWHVLLVLSMSSSCFAYIVSLSEWLLHPGARPGVKGTQEQLVIIFGDVHLGGEAGVAHYEWMRSLLEEFHSKQLPLTLFLEERSWDQVTTHLVNNTLPDLALFLHMSKNRLRHLRHVAADQRQRSLFWSSQFCVDLMQLIAELNYQWPLDAWLKLDTIKEQLSSLYGPSPAIEQLVKEITAMRSKLDDFSMYTRQFPTFKKRIGQLDESWAKVRKNFYSNQSFTIEEFFSSWLLGRTKGSFTTQEFRYMREFLKLDSYMADIWFLAQQLTLKDNNTTIWFVGQKHANALNKLFHDYERNRWATPMRQLGKMKRIRKEQEAKPLSIEQLNTLSLFHPRQVGPSSLRNRSKPLQK